MSAEPRLSVPDTWLYPLVLAESALVEQAARQRVGHGHWLVSLRQSIESACPELSLSTSRRRKQGRRLRLLRMHLAPSRCRTVNRAKSSPVGHPPSPVSCPVLDTMPV